MLGLARSRRVKKQWRRRIFNTQVSFPASDLLCVSVCDEVLCAICLWMSVCVSVLSWVSAERLCGRLSSHTQLFSPKAFGIVSPNPIFILCIWEPAGGGTSLNCSDCYGNDCWRQSLSTYTCIENREEVHTRLKRVSISVSQPVMSSWFIASFILPFLTDRLASDISYWVEHKLWALTFEWSFHWIRNISQFWAAF